MGTNRIGRVFRLTLTVALLGLTGCENGNLFGKLHDSGDSGSTETLLSDGSVALKNQDYSSALRLYNRVLAKDAGNSEALYGAAAAQLGLSGLNFGQLLANLLNNDGTASTTSLADTIAANTTGLSSMSVSSNSVLRGFNLSQLAALTRDAINNLRKIITGATDGKIPPNDVATLLDVAIASIINSAAVMVAADVFDVVNDHGTFRVVNKTSAHAYCSDPQNAATIVQAGRDLCNAYTAINRAAIRLGSTNSVITSFRGDVERLVDEGLDGDGTDDLDSACVTVLNGGGITAASFRNAGDL